MNTLLKIKIIVFASFIVLYTAVYLVTTYDKDELVKLTLEQQIENLENNYKVSKNRFNILSDNFYKNKLTSPYVIELFYKAKHAKSGSERDAIRSKLYDFLKPYFEQFKKSGVNVILFSFENNKTFLRVHKPSKYGDNLSAVRYTVTHVNGKKTAIRGFEQGKISHAFRNVFPLYKGEEYLGSVDFAFSSEVLQENMTKIHGIDTHFIVDKSIFDVKIWKQQNNVKYVQSIENENYFFSLTPSKKHTAFSLDKVTLTKELKEEIAKNIKHNNPFSLYKYNDDKVKIITFLPIKNIKDKKVVAYIVSYSDSYYLERMIRKYYWTNIAFFIALLFLLLLVINNIEHRLYLQKRIVEEVEKNKKQQQVMFEQSRLAQMGEMISMIAHQWRQPLGAISVTSIDLRMQLELQNFNLEDEKEREGYEEYINNSLTNIDEYVKSLTTTIDDFRNFYKMNKVLKSVSLEDVCTKAMKMIESSLKNDNIEIIYDYKSNKKIKIFENEMMHVVLNILKNAQDNFKEKNISNPEIKITTTEKSISIYDNGGGISTDIIDKIFDPYFSTKDAKNGTGLGLYMSKKIIEEHHNGVLSVVNVDDGVCFRIKLK